MSTNDSKKNKPGFFNWILFHPEPMKIMFKISMVVAQLISWALVWVSFEFNLNIFIKVLFLTIAISNLVFVIRKRKEIKDMNTTMNDFVYKGKFEGEKK